MTDAEKLQYLYDRARITDRVIRFALCLDSRDWPGFRDCFTETVVFDFPSSGGLRTVPRDSLLVTTPRFFERLAATQHLSSNHHIEIDGDEAVCISGLHAQHYLPGHPGGEVQRQIGTYRNRLRRDGDDWRIHYSEQRVDWTEGNPAVFDHAMAGRL